MLKVGLKHKLLLIKKLSFSQIMTETHLTTLNVICQLIKQLMYHQHGFFYLSMPHFMEGHYSFSLVCEHCALHGGIIV